MDNLMKLLGDDKGKTDPAEPIEPGESLNEDIDAKGNDDEGFKAAASEAMDAVSSGDVDAFSAALKSCIEMS